MILIYVTTGSKEEAKNIAKVLIEKKLIACANLFPIASLYRWQGKIDENQEQVLILKTAEKLYESVKNEVEKIHSYKIPCILKIGVEGNKKFQEWLEGELI